MKKKIILILLCLFFLLSCAKNRDPEYKAEINSSVTLNI